ncbi:hypothetical protein HXX76_015068 [Chlamydomonas incerta]|uniref:BTB domain-containing protein n=1 Tax=Chlamydomonas incerta TaxID=51695 RepID=A0A835VNX1_CHLIN|nr:hypothetical protein HXX76_015068 [Chlamydomonas incerta]|eukprot:KAG2423792.1 hypothetical protein HXX76_015068 [Chlamydomonas incerta]
MVLHILKTAVPINEPTGVTTRIDASGEVQSLLTTTAGEIYPILGADNRAGLEVGPSLQLFEASESIEQPRRPFGGLSKWVGSPTWDAFSHSVFFIHGGAILRLVGDEVSLVAGDVEERGEQDGVGRGALFSGPEFLVSDGAGSLYCADERSIRRILLPACWAAMPQLPSDTAAAGAFCGAASGFDQLGGSGSGSEGSIGSVGRIAEAGAAAGEAGPTGATGGPAPAATTTTHAAQVRVTTLPFAAAHTIYALAYVPPTSASVTAAVTAGAAAAPAALSPATPPATPGGVGSSSSSPGPAAAGSAAAAIAASTASAAVTGGSLFFATSTAVYRLQLEALAPPPAPPAPAAGAQGAQDRHHGAPAQRHPQQRPQPEAVLVAGREGSRGAVDSPRGADARFTDLFGLAVDAAGAAYLVDKRPSVAEAGIALLRVAPDGAVTTLARGLARMYARPFVLPNGYLVLSCQSDCQLYVLDLGVQPLPLGAGGAGGSGPGLAGWAGPGAAGAAAGPPPRSLPADLGALLDAQPDGTADLTIRVGERRFHVHRAILSARCDYFKQRLAAGGGFADARAAELELPDADPDAFALLLRWLYTGAADIPSPQACGVAVLADRLLLPELSTAAQTVALTCVTPHNAVDCLLWAWGCCDEGRGGSFAHLLSDLKRWYVRHHEQVRRQAGPSRQKLAAAAPALMEELMDAVVDWERSAKWRKA